MATISISDLSNLSLTFPPEGRSAFFRYLRSPDTLRVELDQKQDPGGVLTQFIPSGINFKDPVKLGASGDVLTLRAGVEGNLGICKDTLFDPGKDDFGDSVKIPAGEAYVSACFRASVGAGITMPAPDLQFGFDAGTDLTLTNYRLFDTGSTVQSAIQTLFQGFVIPRDLEDLQRMAPGSVVTVEGTGTLKFSATANLLAATNPLASVTILSSVALGIKEGETVSVGASVYLSGGYQLRVRRLDGNRVQLGFEKKRGETWSINVSAKAGLTGGVASFDVIPTVLGAISKDPVVDADTFAAQTGLTKPEIDTLAAAVKAGIDRTLSLALTGQIESCAGTSAAFSYEVDLGGLDADGQAAVLAALRGDLDRLESGDVAGVVRLRSAFDSLRESKHTLKVNLLGIFNFGRVTDLLKNGKLIVDRETGAITVADRATANRIGFTSDNFAKDGAKLRTVLASGVTMTAGYTVAGALTQMPGFGCSCWSFESHQQTSQQDLQHYVHTAQALGLISASDAASKVTSLKSLPGTGGGPSTFHVEATYGAAALANMFTGTGGQPRGQMNYEGIGRSALASLLPPGDPVSDARRQALQDSNLWAAMREAGSAQNIEQAAKDAGYDAAVAPVIRGDCDLILWWAEAMSGVAQASHDLSAYLAGHPAPDPQDPTLKKLRGKLDDAMGEVCTDAHPRFGEPWGLAVMSQASGTQDATTATLISPQLAFVASRGAATTLAAASGT